VFPDGSLCADGCELVFLVSQARSELESMRQSLLSQSLTGEVEAMERESAFKQVGPRGFGPWMMWLGAVHG
jgi:hypothetical protein